MEIGTGPHSTAGRDGGWFEELRGNGGSNSGDEPDDAPEARHPSTDTGYDDAQHDCKKVDIETGEVVEQDEDDVNRYFISSLEGEGLTPSQWLKLVRMHWGVENNCHNTWDTALEEDDRRWIIADPKGAMNVMLLRRIAYNMLTLFRSVTQRSEEKRMTPWKDILRWVYNTMIAASEADLLDLCKRTATIAEI